MTDFICTEEKKNCPFRNSIATCNFFREYWDIFNTCYSIEIKNLMTKACEKIKNYKLYQKYISNLREKETIKMLKIINIGDILFWMSRSEDVILFEKPSSYDMLERCKCRRYNSKIVDIPAYLLRGISKGDFYTEYLVGNLISKKKIQELENKIKSYGFRPEKERIKEGYLLKIYGDSQREVDDFVNLFIEQGLELSP